MEAKTAEEIKKLDDIVFEMYENDILNTEQYSKIHGQIISVRYAVKDLTIPSVVQQSEPCKHPRSEREYIGEGYLKCKLCGETFK
jgi:hypothetical protein